MAGCEENVHAKTADNISRHFANGDQAHIQFAAASKARGEWFPASRVIAAVDVVQARAIKTARAANQHPTVGALTTSSIVAPASAPNLYTSTPPGLPGPYAFGRPTTAVAASNPTGFGVLRLVPAPVVSSLAVPPPQQADPQLLRAPVRNQPAYDLIDRPDNSDDGGNEEEAGEEEAPYAHPGGMPADIAEAIEDLNATTLSRLAYGKTDLTRAMQVDVVETAKAHIEDLDRKNDDLKIEVGQIAITLDATQHALAAEREGRRREKAETNAELEELRLIREVFMATGIVSLLWSSIILLPCARLSRDHQLYRVLTEFCCRPRPRLHTRWHRDVRVLRLRLR